MSNPPLHPLEEEALRRVRANLLRAMRADERAPSRRERNARRRLTMFGVAAASAVAAGVLAFVLADPSEHDANVDTLRGETVVTTAAPATTVTRPAVTTTTTAPPPPPAPTDFVAVTFDGRLVVVDVATRTELRQLARGADPRTATGEDAPNTITSVTVDRANGIVYYETCCEPAVGTVWSVPLAGGDSTQVAYMSSPALSADGRRLAGLAANDVLVRDLQTATAQSTLDSSVALFHTSLSPDGSLVAYERVSGLTADDARSSLVVAQTSELPLAAAAADVDNPQTLREWRDPEGIGWMHPAINREGNVVVVQQCCAVAVFGGQPLQGHEEGVAARVIDPDTGEAVGSFSYPAAVADQEYDASGSWLLVTLVDGRVLWWGGGELGELVGGYLAADW